jgi:hypothetical protein
VRPISALKREWHLLTRHMPNPGECRVHSSMCGITGGADMSISIEARATASTQVSPSIVGTLNSKSWLEMGPLACNVMKIVGFYKYDRELMQSVLAILHIWVIYTL